MRVDAATLAGGARNQDAYAVLDDALLVLDGASTYPPPADDRDGGWYARTLLNTLAETLSPDVSLRQGLREAIASMRDQQSARPSGPSSTVAIARLHENSVELLLLGDSTVLVETIDGRIHVMDDPRIARIGREERDAYRARLLAGAGFDDEHKRLLTRLQRRQRQRRNRPDGYWIAESDPEAAHHAVTLTMPRTTVRGLLLLTDGAAAAVTRYGEPATWAQLLRQIDSRSAAATLDAIHSVEAADPFGRAWPRAKRHDDKTVLRAQLKAPQLPH